MTQLTIRNLPDEVHARLRTQAADAQLSLESYLRRTLADAARGNKEDNDMPAKGLAQVPKPFGFGAAAAKSASALPELWGALKGSVQVAPATDLTAPAGEAWAAEG